MKRTVARAQAVSRQNGSPMPAATSLQTGKIHVTRASAAQIRLAIGVTRADERVAAKALEFAMARPKTKAVPRGLPRAHAKRRRSGAVATK